MSEVEKLIGKQVTKIRQERNLTQAQLAELLDVAIETVSRLERGVSIPSLKTLEKISQKLDISLKDIFDFKNPTKKTPTDKEIKKLTVFLKEKRAEDIRFGYNVLKVIFEEVNKSYNPKKR